ncbi:MAG: Rab family GTPase [Lysobacterales bacterium]
MKSFKICVLGDFAVGKTSLVRRFVDQAFSDRYLTTVGVKIDTRVVEPSADEQVKLVIWDIAGADEMDALRTNYVRGASGIVLVCDLTRAETLTTAKKLQREVASRFGAVPLCLLANKLDLKGEREVDDMTLKQLADSGWDVFTTSAKTGHNVDEALTRLASLLLGLKAHE